MAVMPLPIHILMPLMLFVAAQAATPEQKAVAFMQSEVPRWVMENRCFSCHNNGDGARSLFLAHRLNYRVPSQALEATAGWLQKPAEWGRSGETGFGDEKLARIQFAAALTDAVDAGFVKDKTLIARAAAVLLPHQDDDGSWKVDVQGASPSAVTYGSALATFMARRTLQRAAQSSLAEAIERADGWLRKVDVATTVNAAAVVLAFESGKDAERALNVLLTSQNTDGGWGPYPNNPSGPFETAMALLALNTVRDKPGVEARIVKGRAFLISAQFEDGGWPGGETYARHISTSAWSTFALLTTKR